MFLKKDNFLMGLIMGLVAPLLGILAFKFSKLSLLSIKDAIQYMLLEPGFRMLSVALSLSLLLNALLFTIYINTHKDKTAKGIFATTLVYGLFVLIIKTFF
jgi:hypothetical protein